MYFICCCILVLFVFGLYWFIRCLQLPNLVRPSFVQPAVKPCIVSRSQVMGKPGKRMMEGDKKTLAVYEPKEGIVRKYDDK